MRQKPFAVQSSRERSFDTQAIEIISSWDLLRTSIHPLAYRSPRAIETYSSLKTVEVWTDWQDSGHRGCYAALEAELKPAASRSDPASCER
jgi:hypothetical protein